MTGSLKRSVGRNSVMPKSNSSLEPKGLQLPWDTHRGCVRNYTVISKCAIDFIISMKLLWSGHNAQRLDDWWTTAFLNWNPHNINYHEDNRWEIILNQKETRSFWSKEDWKKASRLYRRRIKWRLRPEIFIEVAYNYVIFVKEKREFYFNLLQMTYYDSWTVSILSEDFITYVEYSTDVSASFNQNIVTTFGPS